MASNVLLILQICVARKFCTLLQAINDKYFVTIFVKTWNTSYMLRLCEYTHN